MKEISKKSAKETHNSLKKLWDKSISYHKKYMNPITNLFDMKYLELRNCPVCEKNDYRHLFVKEGGVYVRCDQCNMVYLNPVFNDHALSDFYTNNHPMQAEIVENDSDFYTRIYSEGFSLTKIHLKNNSNILDIGCSSGIFLDIVKKKGFNNTYGIELNKAEAKFAEKKGHKIYQDHIENISFDKEFDLITLWDVFEHIKNGKIYLEKIRSLLSRNGLIFIQVPSSASLAARIMQAKCNMYDGLEHVNLYNPDNIKILAEKSGFKIIELKTVISELSVLSNYLNYKDPYMGDSPFADNLFSIISEKEIHKNLLGYKMQVVLKAN